MFVLSTNNYGLDILPKFLPAILRIFFSTYPYYYDRDSRLAVERCIQEIFKADTPPQAWTEFLKTIHAESSKSGLAPSNAFVLVRWCSLLLPALAATNQWEEWGLKILTSNSQALDLCLSLSSQPNVQRSALFATKQGLRQAFDARKGLIEETIEKLSVKGGHPSASNAVMIGAIAEVCASSPETKQIIFDKKTEIYAFYNREIIGSRTHVDSHVANALEDFFANFATKEDVDNEIVPSLEKALLRAPEVVLDDLLSPLFHALPDSIDLSTTLREKLLKPLFANIKSTNATIRQGALRAFKVVVLKCHDVDVVTTLTEDVLTPLKSGKLTSPDQRSTYAEMLAVLPVSTSTATLSSTALAAIAGKEANEGALNAESLALLHYLEWAVQNELSIDKSVVDAIVKGVSDKKVNVRRSWTLRLGELLWSTSDDDKLKSKFSSLAEAAISPLSEIWKEATTNSIAMAQSGLITAAYIFTALSYSRLPAIGSSKIDTQLKKAQIAQQLLDVDPKPSFLLNQRIYGKLTSDDEFRWFIRALSSIAGDVAKSGPPDSAIGIAWAQAFIFCISSSAIRPILRQEASLALSKLYVHNPAQISEIIISGLWRWRDSIEAGEKDSAAAAAKSLNQHLHLVVQSICLSPADVSKLGGSVAEPVRKQQMISLFVLSRPELLPRVSWISLCLKVQVDPGELARSSGDLLIQQILALTDFQEAVSIPFLLRLISNSNRIIRSHCLNLI